MKLLPSSSNWTWGSRQDPLWHTHLEGFEGRTLQHATWAECAEALTSGGRRVHDFYFRVVEAVAACGCGGTGYGPDYAEFLSGFQEDGDGRWAGWGSGTFSNSEFAVLAEALPGHVDHTTRTLVDPASLSHEQEMFVREALGPMVAASFGVESDCVECLRDLGAHDQLLVWSFGETPGSGRIEVVLRVLDEDHEPIRQFMRNAFADVERRLRTAPGRKGWEAEGDDFDAGAGAWFMRNERVSTFAKFLKGVGEADAMNLLFDVHVVPMDRGRCMVRFWITHPARGYGREILVEKATDDDAEALAVFLAGHYEVHRRNFGWALAEGALDAGRDDGRELLAELMKRR